MIAIQCRDKCMLIKSSLPVYISKTALTQAAWEYELPSAKYRWEIGLIDLATILVLILSFL